MKKILVTGGCGFIGSHLVEKLLQEGWETVILDCLLPQVHQHTRVMPDDVLKACRLIRADIGDTAALEEACRDVHAIVHLAAETGVGQSMYEIGRYCSVNVTGTGVLLDRLHARAKHLERFILLSSRAVYGEGSYACDTCGPARPAERRVEDLEAGRWEVACSECGGPLRPLATPEDAPTEPISIYAITKLAQEQLVRMASATFRVPSVILRCQNVYGPRQSLSNPYTGILSLFSTRIQNGLPITIYEDGGMSRDFVHVHDTVEAIWLGLNAAPVYGGVYNVGAGVRTSVLDVAEGLKRAFGREVPLEFDGLFRIGDIRHCFADIGKIRREWGYAPRYDLARGLKSLAEWVETQPRSVDLSHEALKDLKDHGITR